jgi:hypothetical protein
MAKLYQSEEKTVTANEPAVAYQKLEHSDSTRWMGWNPNVPFHGTQNDWREHFHQIEKENFTNLATANQEFDEWKTKLLASRL